MKRLSDAGAALLGLLSEGAKHPYQIEKDVRERDMRYWTDLSMSSIYKLLRKCERAGLVKRTKMVSPQNRLRVLYAISRKGRKALAKKLEALLSDPGHIKWPVDIGIANCGILPRKTVRAALEKYRAGLEERARCYGELQKYLRSAGCPPHRLGIAERPVYLLKAEMKWVDDYLGKLGR